jgi:hypothetical protein
MLEPVHGLGSVMAHRSMSDAAEPFQGKWGITGMALWATDAIDLVGPGFIEFEGDEGEMRFIAVTAWLDVRYVSRDGKSTHHLLNQNGALSAANPMTAKAKRCCTTLPDILAASPLPYCLEGAAPKGSRSGFGVR